VSATPPCSCHHPYDIPSSPPQSYPPPTFLFPPWSFRTVYLCPFNFFALCPRRLSFLPYPGTFDFPPAPLVPHRTTCASCQKPNCFFCLSPLISPLIAFHWERFPTPIFSYFHPYMGVLQKKPNRPFPTVRFCLIVVNGCLAPLLHLVLYPL